MKLPFKKSKRRPPANATVEVLTFEDLFKLIGDSKQRAKEKRKHHVGDSDDAGADALGDHPDDSDKFSLSSVSTFSSMATMDDNPGTGRFLDTHFYQPAGRAIERAFMFIAFLLHIRRGGHAHVPVIVPVIDGDSSSLSTGSNTSTISDNPGTGRIIDKYVYRLLGGMLERCAGRFAMSCFLPATVIYLRIEELWHNVKIKEPCFICRDPVLNSMSAAEKIREVIKRIEDAPSGMFIMSGMKEIIKRTR